MSFRGRYPTRFRRTGNLHGSKRPYFSDKTRLFKRHDFEAHDVSPPRGSREDQPHSHRRGSGSDYQFSDRGRGRGSHFSKRFIGRNLRSFRSHNPRGRYMHHAISERGNHGSPKHYHTRDRDRISIDRSRSPSKWADEEFFSDAAPHMSRSVSPEELLGSHMSQEIFDDEERYIGRRSRSPIIRRSFERDSFRQIRERSFDRRSGSPVIRKSFDRDIIRHGHENAYERRSGSPLIIRRSFERDSIQVRSRSFSRSRSPIFEGIHFNKDRERSLIRSASSVERRGSIERRDRNDEHLSSYKGSHSHISRNSELGNRFQDKFKEKSIENMSRASVEREIRYEKKRRQMLEHQRRFHKKLSESYIE